MSEKVTNITECNIFDDATLGFAPEHRVKAELVDEIGRRMKADKLSQTAGAERMGIKQPDLSDILRGKFRGYSVVRLATMLGKLGYGVDIVLTSPNSDDAVRTVQVTP